jgi:hypothetical protein
MSSMTDLGEDPARSHDTSRGDSVRSQEEREALGAEFDRHVSEEERILRAYHTLSDKLPEGPLSVVVNHIVTDEEMHHFLLQSLADWVRSPATALDIADDIGSDRGELLRLTRELRDHERETIEACSELQERLGGGEGDVYDAVLQAIILDSQKHHRLLRLVESLIEKGSG